MQKLTLLTLTTLLLTACTGGGDTPAPTDITSTDWTLRTESNFTVATPPAYERITTANSDLRLGSDFITAYTETRLDNKFKTTFTIHREPLRTEAQSRTYALAIADSAKNLTDYTEQSLTDITISGKPTALHDYTFRSSASTEPLRVLQTGLTRGQTGWILSCVTRTPEGDTATCQRIIESFTLK